MIGDSRSRRALVFAGAVLLAVVTGRASSLANNSKMAGRNGTEAYIPAGADRTLPAYATFENPTGSVAVLNADGPVATRGHPFFEPLGRNGRACVTCHQPADAMSLSVRSIARRWAAGGAKDSLFAAVDGANCPNLPVRERASHSLLLDKGLFRIGLPWPPRDAEGRAIKPEFDIAVVSDPTGCNSSKVYGLNSKNPQISVFRRPRVAANLKYVEPERPLSLWHIRTGEVRPLDPLTGHRLGGNLMSDSRAATLIAQMIDASRTHMEMSAGLSPSQQSRVRTFLLQVYMAQVTDRTGGRLNGGGAFLGPQALRDGKPAMVGAYSARPMFPEIEGWVTQRVASSIRWAPLVKLPLFPTTRASEASETPQERAYRDSVARGYLSFMYRQFLIRNVADLNGFIGNPVKQTCAACHNMVQTGMDVAPGYLDLGTNTYPTATPAPDLPLFRIDCHKDAPPHPYLGRQIYTSDPGRALVTGRCADVGKVVVQQMRGLAARAPYFAGGSARDLRAVVDYYDTRFRIGYTEQEKSDLINFMGAL
jgi:cytochrome c peroxidase